MLRYSGSTTRRTGSGRRRSVRSMVRCWFSQGTARTYKTRCGKLCTRVCFKFPAQNWWQNRITSDKVITKIRVTFFETQCTSTICLDSTAKATNHGEHQLHSKQHSNSSSVRSAHGLTVDFLLNGLSSPSFSLFFVVVLATLAD